jgi:serine/threonine protein kinase
MKQILNGMRGLHELNVIHRDLKLANILIHNGILKIADLGFA